MILILWFGTMLLCRKNNTSVTAGGRKKKNGKWSTYSFEHMGVLRIFLQYEYESAVLYREKARLQRVADHFGVAERTKYLRKKRYEYQVRVAICTKY